MDLLDELMKLKDEKYKAFHSKLVPNVDENRIIGVRVPMLRKLAKEVAKTGESVGSYYYEELMIKGMAIGYEKCSIEDRLAQLKSFVPLIDNWGVCDCSCSTYKFAKMYQKEVHEFILPYLNGSEFEVRFAIVMLMNYYLNDEFIDDTISILANIEREEYYINMAAAWALSVAFVKEPNKIYSLLKDDKLSDEIHNRLIQKIRESNRVSFEDKTTVLQYKRK